MIKEMMTDSIGFVECIEKFGDDLTVVNAARVSFDKISTELTECDKMEMICRYDKEITYLRLQNQRYNQLVLDLYQ